jgi:class 3 adenylate cyclase
MSVLFAATYPERTTALVLFGSFARRVWAPDYPWAPTLAQRQQYFEWIEQNWGREADVSPIVPGEARDARFLRWAATYLRLSASPGAAAALLRMNSQIDVRHVLPTIRVPTLVLHRVGDLDVSVANGRYLAEHIPGAKYVELPGVEHVPILGDSEVILDEIEEFLTGVRPVPEPDRVLATVLFTDIVGSTEHAVRLGDRRWRDLQERHHALIRQELARHRGREVDTAGDGFFATFDGPARAIRCALAIGREVRQLGLELRAGLHTGECELRGERVSGIAVHTGARVAARAGPGEVLVSSTVKDLVAGSGLAFEDRGVHALKGVLGEWRLFAVAS